MLREKPGFPGPERSWALLVHGLQLEWSGAAECRRGKERGGWSVVSWNMAKVLCQAFMHLQELPWYFNNYRWFNGPSGRRQHWYIWVRATHIIACDILVRQLSSRNQGGTYSVLPFIPACSHVLAGLSFCVPLLQMYCVSSLQYFSFTAGDQGRCREKVNCVPCSMWTSLSLPSSFSPDGERSIDFHSAEASILFNFLCTVTQKKWLSPLFSGLRSCT